MSSQRGADTGPDGFTALLCSLGTERDRRNKAAHIGWSILLASGVIGSAFMLRAGFGTTALQRAAIVAVPIALMVPWLFAYLRFLREADELVRKIHTEGAAVGFWAGFAFGISYVVLVGAGLHFNHSMAVAIMTVVMGAGYGIGRILARKRYQ